MTKTKTTAIWTIAVLLAGVFTVRMSAANRKGEAEPTYRSSIQVPRGTKEDALPTLARITREQAVQLAQGAAAGTVVESALENEKQSLVYTVEVENAGSTSEVVIDAGNGQVLAVQADGGDQAGDHDGDGEQDGDSD